MKKLSFSFRGIKHGEPAGFFLTAIILFLSVFSVSDAQIWEDFTIWYDGNGAESGHISEEYFKSGSNDVVLKMNEASEGSSDIPYTKSGCVFTGWCLYPEGGSVIAPILPGGTVWDPVDVPVTWREDKNGFVFYARWDCNSYVVFYDGNGAHGGKLNPQSSLKYNSITVKSDSGTEGDIPLYRNGYEFTGWNTKPDGTGVSAEPGSLLYLDSDYHLYAMWAPLATVIPLATSTAMPTSTPEVVPFSTGIPTALFNPYNVNVTEEPPLVTPTPQPTALFDPYVLFGKTAGNDAADTKNVSAEVPLLVIPALQQNEPGEASPEMIMLDQNLKSIQDLESFSDHGMTDQEILVIPDDVNASGAIPAKFAAKIEDLEMLPKTGITSRSGFLRRDKPLSVTYRPVNMEIQIPGLNLNGEIVSVQRNENGYPLEWLENDVALLADMADPGNGVSILAAHSTLDADTYGPFAMIHSMEIGDRLFIRKSGNDLLTFEVYANQKISEYDFESLYRSAFQFENTITLLTCEDELPDGGYASRRIVSAKIVD